MSRITMVLVAAVTSATLAVGVAALDAVGADRKTAKPEDDFIGQIAQCLHDHGVALPALSGAPLERWLNTHDVPLAAARTCKEALAPQAPPEVRKRDHSADEADLVACLRAHGADPPSPPADLKRWILGHENDATVARALRECGMGPSPSCGGKEEQDAAPVPGGKDGST